MKAILLATIILFSTPLVKAQDDYCLDQKAKLIEYIKQGYVTCKAAKEIYLKMGCQDELKCPDLSIY